MQKSQCRSVPVSLFHLNGSGGQRSEEGSSDSGEGDTSPVSPRDQEGGGVGESLLSADRIQFDLLGPAPGSPVLNMQYMCETASRLLFLTVHWLKSVARLRLRPDSPGERVLRERWCEAFVLGLAQCASQFGLSASLASVLGQLGPAATARSERLAELRRQVTLLARFLGRCQRLRLSAAEYSYLKILAFAAPGDFPHFQHLETPKRCQHRTSWVQVNQRKRLRNLPPSIIYSLITLNLVYSSTKK